MLSGIIQSDGGLNSERLGGLERIRIKGSRL